VKSAYGIDAETVFTFFLTFLFS